MERDAAANPGVQRRYTERKLPGPHEKSPFFLFSDCVARPIRWLWNEYIPQGMVTLLVGDPGVGKSFFSIDLAARVSCGESIPPDRKPAEGPGRVLFLAADDHPDDIILPRLVAAGADLTRVAGIRNNDFEYLSKEADPLLSLATDIDRVEYALHRLPEARLVVIDPISAYLDGIDINNNVEVRGLLMRLAAMARVYDVAMLLISHHRKAGAPSVLYRALGALAFTSSARVVLSMVRDPAYAERRLLLAAKMNLLPSDVGRAFSIVDQALEWEKEPVPMNADQMQQCVSAGYATSDRREEAAAWLKEFLKEGRRPAVEVHEKARKEGIPRVLVYAAKSKAGAHNYYDGKARAWFWELPPKPSGYINTVAGPVISDAALAFGLPTDQDELEAFYNSRRDQRKSS
jgi:KaiC/GvpD/RAD55 family RecA-like ATPase